MSDERRFRQPFDFNPAVDLPASVYLGQLWAYSLAVLYPAQALKRMALFARTSVGQYPPAAQSAGQGQWYCRRYPDPVLLEGTSEHLESVAEFDRGARLYETLVTPFTTPVDQEALGLIRRFVRTAARILDLGCGPGTEVFRLAELVPQGEVIGVDLASEMVIAAHAGARRRGLTNTAFFQADVTRLPEHFSGRFDVVHSSFAFHHYTDPAGALREVHRALGDEGKAFVIDGGTWWANMISAPFAKAGDPGWVGFHTGEEFQALFLAAGFSDFYWEELLPGIGICVGTR
jgi:SAM-dependent methyltransferase